MHLSKTSVKKLLTVHEDSIGKDVLMSTPGKNTTPTNNPTVEPITVDNPSIVNKKIISPKSVKRTVQNVVKDFAGKVSETSQTQATTFENLLIPVNQMVFDMDMKPAFENVGQDVEMIEVEKLNSKQKTDISEDDKLKVEVNHPTDNTTLSSPQHTPKEANVKTKTSTSINARRSKKQRELEATLAALKPESVQVRRERATIFAQTYLMKVRERFEDSPYEEFIQELIKFKDSNSTDAVSLYRKMEVMLNPHQDLIDEFLAFLLPHQAKQVDRLMDYLLLVKMKQFLIKLEVLMVKQSQQVYSSLEQLASQPNITLTDVHNTILPHLKSSPLLTDYFLQLLPRERPPDSLMIDYEQADCIVGDEDPCYEMIQIPDDDDPYGGEHCPCNCHETERFHCVKCGIKYINGKVYLQHGKFIRPAKVIFEKEDQKKMLELKWRSRGEPEISYNRYHRKRCFPTPGKVSDQNGSAKKSPRTPKLKTGNTLKPKNLKTTKGMCAKKLPMITGIVPLENKMESTESNEFGGDRNKDVKSLGDSENEEHKDTLALDDSDNATQEEDETMCDRSDCKSPTFSQIADIPSVLSPMSFYNESLQTSADIEPSNKRVTNEDSQLSTGTEWKFILKPFKKTKEEVTDLIVSDSGSNKKHDVNVYEDSSMFCSIESQEVKDDKNSDKRILLGVKLSISNDKIKTPEPAECTETSTNKSEVSVNTVIPEITKSVDVDREYSEISRLNDQTEKESDSVCENPIKVENEQSYTASEIEVKKVINCDDDKMACVENEESVEQIKTNVDKGSQSGEPCWTRDEDKIILQVLQQEGDTEQTFVKISQMLPSRTVTEIQNRFKVLLQLLQQMTGVANDNQM